MHTCSYSTDALHTANAVQVDAKRNALKANKLSLLMDKREKHASHRILQENCIHIAFPHKLHYLAKRNSSYMQSSLQTLDVPYASTQNTWLALNKSGAVMKPSLVRPTRGLMIRQWLTAHVPVKQTHDVDR